jgi:hypothetical protein
MDPNPHLKPNPQLSSLSYQPGRLTAAAPPGGHAGMPMPIQWTLTLTLTLTLSLAHSRTSPGG